MLVSIVTVVYNGEKYLEDTIKSVLQQTYANIEYIIIDGGSKDGTVDIIKKYADKLAFWVSEKDNGIYDAMNKGIGLAKGEIIGLINSDDYYSEDAVAKVVKCFEEDNTVDIVHGDMAILYPEKTKIKPSREDNIKYVMDVNHPTCFVRRTVYEERLFDLRYRLAADYDFLLWCKLNNKKFYNIKEVVSYYRPIGITGSPTIGNADAFHIWKKYFGLIHATTLFSKDFLLKAVKVPIKKLVHANK